MNKNAVRWFVVAWVVIAIVAAFMGYGKADTGLSEACAIMDGTMINGECVK